jgi:hypothetical protein
MEMAIVSTGIYDYNCLFCIFDIIPIVILMEFFQTFLVLIVGFLSLGYVIKTLINSPLYSSKKNKDNSCGPDCGCH